MCTLLQNYKCIFFLIYKARQCTDPPPSPWLGIDMDWPLKKQTLGTIVTYNCPFMTKTNKEELASTYVLPSISSTYYTRIFRMKFWCQKFQSWNATRESFAIWFHTKKVQVKCLWSWHLAYCITNTSTDLKNRRITKKIVLTASQIWELVCTKWNFLIK